jgi:hypothetical protein
MPPSEIEDVLFQRGLSLQMAAIVVRSVTGATRSPERSFSNLHLDLWQVVRSNPVLFILFPVLVWYPFGLLAEYLELSAGGGSPNEFRAYGWLNYLAELLVGAWVSAVVFNGVRRLAVGPALTVRDAIVDGSRQYGLFLKTAWSVSWRVGLASLFFLVPGGVLSVWYALAAPATAFEGKSGADAVRASRELMKGRSWRLFWRFVGFSLVYLPWWLAAILFFPPTRLAPLNAIMIAPGCILVSLWSIWLGLTYVDASRFPGVAPPVGSPAYGSVDAGLHRDTRKGRKRVAATAGLGLAALLFSQVISLDAPVFEGEHITFGNQQQHAIYYEDDMQQTEAWLLGNALANIGAFDAEEPLAVRLGGDGAAYWLYVHASKELPSDEKAMETLRWMEGYLGEAMGKPMHIVMLLSTFSGEKEVLVSGWDRRSAAGDAGLDSGRVSPLRLAPDVTIVSEPILQSAGENPDVSSWVEEWAEECGAFSPWSFEFLGVEKRVLETASGRDFLLLADADARDALRSTLEWSPSNDFAFNIFVHNMSRRGSAWSPRRVEPEQWLYLFRAADHRGWPVLILGPSAFVHAIGWTDERTAVALGIAPDDTVDCLYLWRMQVDDSTVTVERHQGPAVSDAQRERLSGRWLAWVKSHYPEVEWAAE